MNIVREGNHATSRHGGSLLALAAALVAAACASIGSTSATNDDARGLAGIWVDSAKATPGDTTAWKLDGSGADWTLKIRVVRDGSGRATTEQTQTRYGYWYLQGALGDTTGRALCFKPRPRDGGTCYPFRLDTLGGGGALARRQIVIAGYRGQQHSRTRVLVERLP
jgi:hypothetical protein